MQLVYSTAPANWAMSLGYLMPNPLYTNIHYIWFVNNYFIGNIFLDTVKWFQVLLYNTDISIEIIDVTLISTTNPG